MRSLFRRGNRLFTVTCLLLLLAAAGHTSALFAELPEALTPALDEMKLAAVDTGTRWSPSLYAVLGGAWVQVGALLAGMALLNLVALASSGGDGGVKRALTIANLIVFVPMTFLFVVVQVPQPLAVFAAASLLFGIDLRYSWGSVQGD